jgi:large subunit ribosomal protein L1
MGKIRMKTIGDKEVEKKQADSAKKRQEVKKSKKETEVVEESVVVETVQAPVQVEAETVEKSEKTEKSDTKADKKSSKKGKKDTSAKQHRHTGKKYKAAASKREKTTLYTLADAIKKVREMAFTKFDETLEVHVNTREGGVKGEVVLPHGTGKEIKIAIVDDAVLKAIDNGVFDFDILITTPANMPQLVKYARVLGPKGLMPNPKNGTVTDKPEEAVKKFQGGSIRYQTEAKFPIIHQAAGKLSFTEDQLLKNVTVLVDALKKKNIASMYLSATMTPSVQVDVESL